MSMINIADAVVHGDCDVMNEVQAAGFYGDNQQYRLIIDLENCFNYYINGVVHDGLKKVCKEKGFEKYFKCKREDLRYWTSCGNLAFSEFINLRPSLKLFLENLGQPNGLGLDMNNYPPELDRKVRYMKELRVKERGNFDRRARKNRKSIRGLMENIYQKRSKVLILRLDLWYEIHALLNKNKSGKPESMKDSIESITGHRDEFVAYLREHFTEKLLGYVWKLEYGLSRGYHLHFLIMLDGQLHSSDVIICKMLGEHWKKEITNNQGGYFNCNAVKHKYKNLAIGMTSYADQEKRSAIENIVKYFTKFDILFQVKAGDAYRTFGRSGLIKSEEKRGRPRLN